MFEKTEWESTCGGDTARTANSGDLFKTCRENGALLGLCSIANGLCL